MPNKFYADVAIKDTRQFRLAARAFRKAPNTWAHVERTFYIASARTVAGMARAEAISQGGIAAKSAPDVRTGSGATVVYGGQGYSMGAEFGAYRYKQFQIWRGNKDDAGYFLWPSIRTFRDKEFLKKWTKDVWRVVLNDIKL